MTRSTCLGFLTLPQFTGPEGRELRELLEAFMARHDVLRSGAVPADGAIGIYYIREIESDREVAQ
ncbi:MAG: hypothetical protein O2894_07855 [Planctomycetota bacterium]|nr:hypothetical protein [Planctomycetota bacterium]